MTLDNMLSERHLTEGIRLLTATTLESANAGAIQAAEDILRLKVRRKVQEIEAALTD